MLTRVRAIHAQTGQRDGSRRMARQLHDDGFAVGRFKARQLMRQAGVVVRSRKRFTVTTDSRHPHPVAPNLLRRQFTAAGPNQVWATDITYVWTAEGWLYVAVVMDLYARKIVGWALGGRLTVDLVSDALRMALGRRAPATGLLHHSDRGRQYASHVYQQRLAIQGLQCRMSRQGDCWDNAVVERFFGSLKRERTDHRCYATRQVAKIAVIDDIEMFYNSRRKYSYLGYVSPNEFEALAWVA